MIFRSPFADTDVPDVTLTQYVLREADRLADKIAMVDSSTGVSLTYGELSRRIRGVAAGLAREGVRKGDVVALNSCNQPDYPVAFHAIASLGAIVTTINPLSTANELAQQLSDSGAKIIIAGADLIRKSLDAAASAGLDTVFAFGGADGARPFDSLDLRDVDPPHVDIDPTEDVVALPYSSGTTGLPKGVMLTHRNLVGNLRQFEALEHIDEDDTLVCVLPMYHIYGMTVIMNGGLAVGATVVTMPRFDLESFLSTICRYRVTFAHVVPPIVLALAKLANLEKYDLSRLRVVFSGAAPLGPDISRECADHIGCAVLQGYGMTELSPGTHSAASDAASVRYGSVGHLLPNTECRIIDVESGEDCDAGREGEILVRGVQVMQGLPQSTRGDCGDGGLGRMAAHRRRRLRRRRWLLLRRRSREGADQVQRLPSRACRARGTASDASGRRRCRGRTASRSRGR